MWFLYASEPNVARHPFFYERDESFRMNVNQQILRKRRNTVSPVGNTSQFNQPICLQDELDEVWYMFSHLILAYNQMHMEYSTPKSIFCENGYKLVMRQPMEDVLIFCCVGMEDEDSSVSRLERIVDTTHALLKFVYGPSYNVYLAKHKESEWKGISLLIHKWLELLNLEQNFLVEALEELQGNFMGKPNDQNSLTSMCDMILREAATVVKAKLGPTYDFVIHSVLSVESRIIKVYSSIKDQSISSYDIMMALVIALAYFPSNVTAEDFFTQTCKKEDIQLFDPVEDIKESDGGEKIQKDRYFIGAEEIDVPTTDSASMLSAEELQIGSRDDKTSDSKKSQSDNSEIYVKATSRQVSSEAVFSDSKTNSDADFGIEVRLRLNTPSDKLVIENGDRKNVIRVKSSSVPRASTAPSHERVTKPSRRRHMSLSNLADAQKIATTERSLSFMQTLGSFSEVSTPLVRPSSVDSGSSFFTCRLKPDSGSPLDTEELLQDVLSNHDKKHLTKGLFVHKRVYIHTSACDYVPACLYVISLAPGINLLVIAQVADPRKVAHIMEPMNLLHDVVKCAIPRENIHPGLDKTIDRMSGKLKEMQKACLSYANNPEDEKLKRCLKRISDDWSKIFVQISGKPGSRDQIKEVSLGIMSVIGEIKLVFASLFMRMADLHEDAPSFLEQLKIRTNIRLRFHKTILVVKANRNMAISAYQTENYPGIIHFIYINRNRNVVKCPSLQLPKDDFSLMAQVIRDMKRRLWKIMPWIYRQLSKGFVSFQVKDGDFIFWYEIAFYNETSFNSYKPKPDKEKFKMLSTMNSIGDMNGRFFELLNDGAAKDIKCTELLTVHLAVTPYEWIEVQRDRLRSELHDYDNPYNS